MTKLIETEYLPLSITYASLAFEISLKKPIQDPIFKPNQHQVVLLIPREI